MEHLRIIVIHVAFDFPLLFIEGMDLHEFDVEPYNMQGGGCRISLGDEAIQLDSCWSRLKHCHMRWPN